MRLPLVPILVTAAVLAGLVYLLNTTGTDRRILDAPRVSRLADLEGTETETAVAPDGDRCAVVSAGDLWLLDLSTGSRRRLTRTLEAESFPSWTPDGRQITFTRGPDTFVIDPVDNSVRLFRANAASLSWSPTGSVAFVRNRALWAAGPNGENERQLVEADPNPDITVRAPRFSPDSVEIAFIKSQLLLRGEVWVVNVATGEALPIVTDRMAENPLDTGWITDGTKLVYLTNRSGTYGLWYVDFEESTILPLTLPLVAVPLEHIGISVWKDRIVMPRHFVNSDIVLSDGTTIVATEKLEFQPAVSSRGNVIAYTVENDDQFEIWTVALNGGNPTFRTLGREPRFAPNGFELIFTYADLNGNDDIWKIDIRTGTAGRVTDADEIDLAADVSPDGRSIAFSSARGGPLSLWTVAASGGKRLRLTDRGYAPRYSPDGRRILYWSQQALWSVDASGGQPQRHRDAGREPVPGAWSEGRPVFYRDSERHPIWPRFDVLSDGRWVVAPIEILETGLWAVDLQYREY